MLNFNHRISLSCLVAVLLVVTMTSVIAQDAPEPLDVVDFELCESFDDVTVTVVGERPELGWIHHEVCGCSSGAHDGDPGAGRESVAGDDRADRVGRGRARRDHPHRR